jgi:hypothetical protein
MALGALFTKLKAGIGKALAELKPVPLIKNILTGGKVPV